jgi:drug/metabolite transporter (DMT)-like permease
VSGGSSTYPENTTLGIVLIIASVFLLSLGDALVKRFSADFSLWQIYVARSLFAVPMLLAILSLSATPGALKPKSIRWVFARSMLLVLMWIAYYAALPAISLSVAAVALYTSPLFIALFSAFLIGEAVGFRRWIGIATGFLGVLVILRPDTDEFSMLAMLPILAAIFYALAAVVTRTKCLSERPLVLSLGLNLCLFAVGAILSGALAVWSPSWPDTSDYGFLLGRWTTMGALEWGLIAVLAVIIVAVSTGVAKAYQSGPAAIIGTFDYAYLVFAVLWSLLIFSETPDVGTLAGILLIVAAGALVVGPSGNTIRTRVHSVER